MICITNCNVFEKKHLNKEILFKLEVPLRKGEVDALYAPS